MAVEGGAGSVMKTIEHLRGTQPKRPRPPASSSLCPPHSSQALCLLLVFPPLTPPSPHLTSKFPPFSSRQPVKIQREIVKTMRRTGCAERGITFASTCWNIRCAALGHRGCHVFPSVRSGAWEGLAARNANNLSCRLPELLNIF